MATIGAIPSPPPKWQPEHFDCASITNDTIELLYKPTDGSLFVFLNGQYLSEGDSYDYTLSEKTISFNQDVLTTTGLLTVKYSYT